MSESQSEKFDPYAVLRLWSDLEVEHTWSREQLQAAYRRASQRAHPDKGGTLESMKDVNMAWKILADPEMRRAFDLGLGSDVLNISAQAFDFLREQIGQVIRVLPGPLLADELDLVTRLRERVCFECNKMPQQIALAERELRILRGRASRVLAPEGNLLSEVIDRELKNGESAIATMKTRERVLRYALEHIRDWRYSREMTVPELEGLKPPQQGLLS